VKHFPLFLDLGGRRVLIVGPGEGVAQKLRLMRDAGASVVLVDTGHALPQEIRALAVSVRDEFRPEDVRGCALAFVCGAADETARSVSAAASEAGVPVNVQDRPELSTFIMPAILDRDPVTVAVSTGGSSPMLARVIRDFAGAILPRSIGSIAAILREFRCEVADRIPSFDLRRRFWEAVGIDVLDRFADGEQAVLRQKIRQLLDSFPTSARGSVYIVGAGPGDPGLLTVRALRALQLADVVLYDRLVDDRIVGCAGSRARLVCVGKSAAAGAPKQDEINRLMADLAMAGRRVVRLKSGDPFVFGRGGEEIEYLARLGLAVEVVPGITAALGCAAYAGIPLTHRECASSVTFISGRGAQGREPDLDWAGLARGGQTLVVYMGVEAASLVSGRLIENGSDPATLVAVIENGTRPDQRVAIGTLGGLADLIADHEIDAPALIIIGEVVRLYRKTEFRPALTRSPAWASGLLTEASLRHVP
jgi:uroporphyrin-III C-methyltransferase / precorrin-2 dehydrogenase / sirohydrochlorin ferrochelatase